MDAWETLRNAIPKGGIKAVAARMHVSYDWVCRWRREPLSSEAPLATGQASPLSRTCELIDAVFHEENGEERAGYIVEHIRLHYELLANAHRIKGFDGSLEKRTVASADLLTQATSAVVSLQTEGITEDTIRRLALLRDAANSVLFRVGKDLYHKQETPTASNLSA